MATKAERFRTEEQKAAHLANPGKAKPRKIGARRGRGKDRIRSSTSRTRKSSYELEVSRDKSRPTRKSTRKALNRRKNDSSQRLAQVNRNATPAARAVRRSGNPS